MLGCWRHTRAGQGGGAPDAPLSRSVPRTPCEKAGRQESTGILRDPSGLRAQGERGAKQASSLPDCDAGSVAVRVMQAAAAPAIPFAEGTKLLTLNILANSVKYSALRCKKRCPAERSTGRERERTWRLGARVRTIKGTIMAVTSGGSGSGLRPDAESTELLRSTSSLSCGLSRTARQAEGAGRSICLQRRPLQRSRQTTLSTST